MRSDIQRNKMEKHIFVHFLLLIYFTLKSSSYLLNEKHSHHFMYLFRQTLQSHVIGRKIDCSTN